MIDGKFTSYSAVVGQVLINMRTEKDINQGEMAKAVGVGQSTWSRIEKGEVALSIDQLARASRKLEVTPSKVLAWADQAVEKIREEDKAEVLTDKPVDVKQKVKEKDKDNTGAILLGAGALAALIWAARK